MIKYIVVSLTLLLQACVVFEPSPELHYIGVYESAGGEVVVHVSITDKPLILALTAYEKTHWVVRADDDVQFERVILGGYHTQEVTGIPEETLIDVYIHDSSHCLRCYQGQGYFFSYESVPTELKKITGLDASSWQARYSGVEFSIFRRPQ